MIEHTLYTATGILHLRPTSALQKEDFEELAKVVDPYIEERGGLAGLIVEAKSFPGWESLGAMAAHLRFVKDHHRKIRRIAIVTDSPMGNVVEHLVSHFVVAEVRHFSSTGIAEAQQWILATS